MPRCPFCRTELDENATQCYACEESMITTCKFCKEEIRVYDTVCPSYKTNLVNKQGFPKEGLKALTTISYILVLISVLSPFFLSNSLSEHHEIWKELLAKRDDYVDMVSAFTSLATMACIPSVVAICMNYRKRVSAIIIGTILIFCIINIALILSF